MTPNYCGAKKRQGEGTCTRPAGWGTSHPGQGCCKLHGGSTGNHVAAAADAEARAAARVLLKDAGPIENPLQRILELAGEACAWLEATRDAVQARIDTGDLTQWGEAGRTVSADVMIYTQAMAQAKSVLDLAASKNVEARLTALAERDMARIEATFEAVWRAGRDGASLDEARKRAARHLRVAG
jgi:hypothetical protein